MIKTTSVSTEREFSVRRGKVERHIIYWTFMKDSLKGLEDGGEVAIPGTMIGHYFKERGS
jgi:hypothetical protein